MSTRAWPGKAVSHDLDPGAHKKKRLLMKKPLGAGNGARTRDPELGKLMLYQLSYSREQWI